MIRNLAGIAAGIAVAVVVMVVIEGIGNQIHPPPTGLDPASASSAASMPFGTLIFPVLGWFLGPLTGGALAVWSSRHRWASWPVAAVVVIGAVLRFALTAHPAWVMAAGVAAPVAGAWLAQLIVRRGSAAGAA